MKDKKKKPKPKWLNYILDLLFPKRCAWCGKVKGFHKECPCEISLKELKLPTKPLNLKANGQMDKNLTAAWACFVYEIPVSQAVWRLKFQEDWSALQSLGEVLAAKATACRLQEKFDVVVPVPLSPKRYKRRGYNQSLLLANEMVKETSLVVLDDVLLKPIEVRKQMELSHAQRMVNVQGAYNVEALEKIQGKRVLLVDDVITTGATLNECAKTLVEAGAKECGAICVASVTSPAEKV